MSSSSWPPQLKAWVQENLAKATASNKPAVNAELKDILSKAFTNGTLQTTDWSTVELESLKKQSLRTTHVPTPPAPIRINVSSSFTSPPIPSRTQAPAPPPASSFNLFSPFMNNNSPTVLPPPSDTSSITSGSASKKKKRKKNESEKKSNFPTPYVFQSEQESEALARRAARFAQPSAANGGGGSNGASSESWFTDTDGSGIPGFGMLPGQVGRKKMKGKGGLGYGGVEVMEVDPNVIDWDRHTIRGTSTKLEKSYLRLTSEPSPADIRPLSVLQQTLQLLKRKWKENHNYAYAVDQFKSMRQDLTVQRIKNEFTVEVYEIHARIALEAKDLGEYNQCQSMLRQLYELGIKGHPQEFLSYRIIYLLHTRNRSDMASLLAQLTTAEKADPGVQHALQVHAALATSNYVRFFRLYTTAPNMSGYIMDHFVERERMAALAILSKAYMTLPLTFLSTTLAFDSDQDTDEFLSAHKASIYLDPNPPAPTTTARNPSNPWKTIQKPPIIPLNERIWDCKKAQGAVMSGMDKYRVVDLKGQVN